MGRFLVALLAFLFLGGATLAGEPPAKAKGKKKDAQVIGATGSTAAVQIVFGSREVEIIRAHYAPRYRNLPPGLQKKVARGGQLPPGWQKKLEPFPADLDRQLHPLPRGYRRGVLDAHAVIFDAGTSVIVDLAVLF